MGDVGIRIIGLGGGHPTPYDGQWLAEYDPDRPGVDPNGQSMMAHVVGTDDPAEAMRFPSAKEAHACWRLESGARPDGKPHRPLTAFTIEVKRLP